MSETCRHCGSSNISKKYKETFPVSGSDYDELTTLEEAEVFDCLECGELAQDTQKPQTYIKP